MPLNRETRPALFWVRTAWGACLVWAAWDGTLKGKAAGQPVVVEPRPPTL